MSQNQMIPGEYETDPLSPDYGSPSYYNVSSAHSGLVRIHPSRVVRFYGSELPENGYGFKRGESVLQSLMTSVIHYDGTMTNVASLIFEAKIDIIKVPDLASLLADPVTETQVINRYNLAGLMKGNNGMLLLSGASSKDGVGEEYEQKQMSFSGLTDIIDRMQMQVAGAANSNRSRMFGVSAGGLGSNGNLELSTYYDFINSRQTNYLEPAITLLDEVIIRSALGSRPDDVWYQWNSLWQISDKEKADIGVALSSAAKSLIDGGLFTAEILAEPVSLALVNAGVFPGLDQSLADFIQSGGELEHEPEIEDLPPVAPSPNPTIKDELPVIDPTLQLLTNYLSGAK
jgi:phage-related protein (TIGR01555 family)